MLLQWDSYSNVLKMATIYLDCIWHTDAPAWHEIGLNDRFCRMHRETIPPQKKRKK